MMLRKLKEKDVDGMLEWMHDPDVYRFFRFSCENTNRDKALDFIHEAQLEFEDGSNRHYAIADDQDEYLGTISLKNIDCESQTAEYAVSLRSEAQGQGLATKATNELLRIAFEDMKLCRVYLNVLSGNEKAIHLYEKCGFVYEGEFRNHLRIRGQVRSLKWFGMLREEYEERKEKI